MIPVDIFDLPEIYIIVFLAAIFTLWIAYKMVRKRTEAKLLRHHLQCSLCGMEFEDSSLTILPRCPRCGSLNERKRASLKTRYR